MIVFLPGHFWDERLTKIFFAFDNSMSIKSTDCGKGMWIISHLQSALNLVKCSHSNPFSVENYSKNDAKNFAENLLCIISVKPII